MLRIIRRNGNGVRIVSSSFRKGINGKRLKAARFKWLTGKMGDVVVLMAIMLSPAEILSEPFQVHFELA